MNFPSAQGYRESAKSDASTKSSALTHLPSILPKRSSSPSDRRSHILDKMASRLWVQSKQDKAKQDKQNSRKRANFHDASPDVKTGFVLRGGGGGGGGFLGATVGVAKVRASVYSSSSVEEGEDKGVSGAESNGFEGASRLIERRSSVT